MVGEDRNSFGEPEMHTNKGDKVCLDGRNLNTSGRIEREVGQHKGEILQR